MASSSLLELAYATMMVLVLTISYLPSTRSARRLPLVGFEARMIHRSSPESPMYDPNMSPSDLSRLAARAARARTAYRAARSGDNVDSGAHTDAYTSPLLPFGPFNGEYIMRYDIGSHPPIETYGIPDTGSSLIWLQCLPCERCYDQNAKLFDPSKSSSYEPIKCRDSRCNMVPETMCLPRNPNCRYNYTYEDDSMSSGELATETIILQDDANQSGAAVKLTGMIIGCGHYNIDNREGNKSQTGPPGVVGMNRDPSSLIGQLSFTEFSYCASGNRASAAGHSLLKIGLGSVITGKETQTPLYQTATEQYFVKVKGIMLDGEMLDIPPVFFDIDPDGIKGTIIDSGTTYTELVPAALDRLVSAIKKDMSAFSPAPIDDPDFALCYADVDLAPQITIAFENLNFDLSKENTWDLISPRKYCLAIFEGFKQNTIGMFQMRSVNVGFDLKNNVVSFQKTVCPTVK